MKGKVYATKIYSYLLMTRLACDQLWPYHLCRVTIMSLCSTIKYDCTSHRSNIFSKSGGWLTRLGQHKTSIFCSLCHCRETQSQLEQADGLRCEDTPPTLLRRSAAPWLPILSIHIGSQVKTRHSQSYKFQEFTKSSKTHLMLLDKIRCVNMKCIRRVLLNIQSGHDSVDRRTDGHVDGRADKRTRWNQYTPSSTHWSGGYDIIQIVLPLTSDPVFMAKKDYMYIYIHIHHEPQTSMLKHTSLNSV